MAHLLGYARVSTGEQHPDLQVDALTAAGCYRVFVDRASGALAARPALDQVLDQLRPGDTLVVGKLDRLGRSLRHLDDRFQGVGVVVAASGPGCQRWGGRPGSALQTQRRACGGPVDATLDTLATALYVKIDELLQRAPHLAPWRPAVGIAPKLTDAELVTLAVLQALLGFCSEARWLRYAHAHLGRLFPYLPKQPGYNKRLRAAADLLRQAIRVLAADTTWWTDDVWVADSTPVECGRSTHTVGRSELAGWAQYGYCASHSRYFWGLRLHLVCTLHGLPVGFALAGAKADERQVLLGILAADPALAAT